MLHFHKTNEFIIVVGGVSTYNFMFYVNVRRLNKCQFELILCIHMLFSFLSPMLSYFPVFSWSLVDVLTSIVLTGNYKNSSSHTFPFR